MHRGRLAWALGGLVVLLVPVCTFGQETATATIQQITLGPSSYEYQLTLTNTGQTPIETFWFGWVPGYDLLLAAPTKFFSPAGWNGINAPDFYGVASAQWTTTTSPLQPGQTLSGFAFDTPESNVLTGTAPPLSYPIEYSYVYKGAPEAPGDGGGFIAFETTVTPEPASLALLAILPLGLLRRRSRLAITKSTVLA